MAENHKPRDHSWPIRSVDGSQTLYLRDCGPSGFWVELLDEMPLGMPDEAPGEAPSPRIRATHWLSSDNVAELDHVIGCWMHDNGYLSYTDEHALNYDDELSEEERERLQSILSRRPKTGSNAL